MRKMEIDLDEFLCIENSNGPIMIGEDLLLRNIITGMIVQMPYDQVYLYFGLPARHLDVPVAGTSSTLPFDSCDSFQFPSETLETSDATPVASSSSLVTESQVSHKWTESETKFMLNLYGEMQNSVGPMKRFRTKKLMWAHLATQLEVKFKVKLKPIQVESRYKCVVKRTKKVSENNSTSGTIREETPYDDDMYDIVRNDDSLCVDTGMSPGQTFRKDHIYPERPSTSSSPNPERALALPNVANSELDDGARSNSTPIRRARKTKQQLMFASFLAQKQEHFELREERRRKRDEKNFAVLDKILKILNKEEEEKED